MKILVRRCLWLIKWAYVLRNRRCFYTLSRLQKNPCLLSVILNVNDYAFQSLSEQKKILLISMISCFFLLTQLKMWLKQQCWNNKLMGVDSLWDVHSEMYYKNWWCMWKCLDDKKWKYVYFWWVRFNTPPMCDSRVFVTTASAANNSI